MFFDSLSFEKRVLSVNPIEKGEYENCVFKDCDFAEADFRDYKFIDCKFIDSNLSLVKLNNTALREVRFVSCKMLGLRFDSCNEFNLSVHFENCVLNHSSFYAKKLRKTHFIKCNLQDVDFTSADLSESILEGSDLLNAHFENTVLEKVDFRGAFNYVLDPDNNKVKKAIFDLQGIPGLLEKYKIVVK